VSPRGFGRHWANEHGHLHTPNRNDERTPSTFPPDLLAENLATLERMKAERERKP
jgi:hypothetical protein